MTFDPDAYLAKKQSQPAAFDPDAYLASKGQKAQSSEKPQSLSDEINNAILSTSGGRVLSEFAAAANKPVFQLLDFFGADNINAVLDLVGSDQQVPTLSESLASDGGYMGEGLGRDIVQAGGQTVPIALGAGQAMRTMANKLPTMAAGESAATGMARQLGQSTARQDATAGALAATGGELGEEVGGADGKLIGSMALPLTMAAPALAKEGVKSAFRGRSGQPAVKEAVKAFGEVGATPTLGQATGSKLREGIENRSGQILGGGAVRKSIEQTTNKIQSRLAQIADDISPVRGDVEAGRVVQKGVIGKDGFVERFQAKSGGLWQRVSDKVPSDARSSVENTKNTLDDLVRNDSFGKALNNPKLSQVKDIFGSILGKSRINQVTQTRETVTDIAYKDLASLRRTIGEMLGSKDLISDVPRAQLKRLYASLSEDIKGVASQHGALPAYNRANSFTAAGHNRLDDFVERVAGKVDLDKVFQAMAKGGEGTQALNAMKRSLKPDEWEAVAANVIRKLGEASKGQQDAAGEIFSVPKLLTDWNKLGAAKKVLFSGSPKLNAYSKNLDRVAQVADRVKESIREGANPSGTGQLVANFSLAGAGITGAVTGNHLAVAGVLSTIAANKATASLMTSPKFVQWLAQASTVKNLPAHIARLEAIGNSEGLSREIMTVLDGLKAAQQNKDQQQQ